MTVDGVCRLATDEQTSLIMSFQNSRNTKSAKIASALGCLVWRLVVVPWKLVVGNCMARRFGR